MMTPAGTFVTGLDTVFFMLLSGGWLFSLWVTISNSRLSRSISRLAVVAGAGMCINSLLLLGLRSLSMSGQSMDNLFSVMELVLWQTDFGKVWILRMMVSGLLFVWVLGMLEQTHPGKAFHRDSLGMALLLSILGWTLAATGHAADQGYLTMTMLTMWGHILTVSLWGGGIMTFVWLSRVYDGDDRDNKTWLALSQALSRTAGIALVLVVVTGMINGLQHLHGFSNLWDSSYGRILGIKVFLVMIMVLLGGSNRLKQLPRLVECDQRADMGAGFYMVMQQFLLIIRIEFVVLLGVISLAAWLSQTMPPMTTGTS